MIYYAKTNQKQAFDTEGGMKEKCNERETQGKHYAIVLGASLVDVEFTNYFFFSARLYYLVKP